MCECSECSKVFHASCLNRWCETQRLKTGGNGKCTCPLCRALLSIEDEFNLRETSTPTGEVVATTKTTPDKTEKKTVFPGKDKIWHLKVPHKKNAVQYHCMMRERHCAAIVQIQGSYITAVSTCRYRLLISGTHHQGGTKKWIVVPNSRRISLNIRDAVSISVCLEISLPHGP